MLSYQNYIIVNFFTHKNHFLISDRNLIILCARIVKVMFPFGSFITQIPLILFSALYLLYFGAFTLNKIRNREAQGDQPVSCEHQKVIVAGSDGYFHYFDHNTTPDTDIESINELFRIYELPEESSIIPPEYKEIYSAPGYSNFCRPPPVFVS